MQQQTIDNRPDTIYCKCGCGEIIPHKRYPSQQNYYINGHQHRGTHNGNYRGGQTEHVCPVCLTTFKAWTSQNRVTCGNADCLSEWQRLTTAARGKNQILTKCANCGRDLYRWPSQIQENSYCNLYCMAADNPKTANNNGNWQGGKWRYIKEQVMIRDGHKCAICGFDIHIHVHHITALADGGTNDFSNLITLCPNHHAMADRGIINVEHLRNYEWQPSVTTDPTPHANH